MRYAALVAEKLPLHPSAREPEYRRALKELQKTLPDVINFLEALKPRILARYDVWEEAMQRRRKASIASHYDVSSQSRNELAAASDPAVAGNTTTLAAAENSELAVKLAQKEIRRRDAARRGTRQAGVTEEEEQERRTAGIWDDWEAALSKDMPLHDDDDEMRRNMEASRRRMDGSHDIVPDVVRKRSSLPRSQPIIPTRNGSAYRYPSIAKSQPYSYEQRLEPQPSSHTSDPLPPKPPKESYQDPIVDIPPPRPEKATPSTPESAMPSPNPPPAYTFRPSAYLENGEPLRTIFLPKGIRQEFLKYAESNTRRNLETCGMLCGTLISNALFISQVVIPDQKSTSDTCETTNDAAFFDYCEKEDLLQLGWIHTHPTQSCFMSSVDLHTHCAYQMMMKESIAIVCAPSKTPS